MRGGRRTRAAALAAMLAGCRAPAEDGARAAVPAFELPVQRRGETIATAALRAGTDVDLWRYCDGAGVTAVTARGADGRFVSGACATREQRRLSARPDGAGAAVVSLRDRGGALVAEVGGVEAITVVAPDAEAAGAVRADLVVVLPGGQERRIAAGAIAAAAGPAGERGRGHGSQRGRAAASLPALLAEAGVDLAQVEGVTLEGRGKRRELSAATLRDPDSELRLRYNRRGQLRFGHIEGGREREKLRGVERIIVRGR